MTGFDRDAPPPRAAIRDFEFPAVDRDVLPSGLDLRVAHLPRLPVASVRLFVRAGEGAVPGESAGLPVLAAEALEGGTKRRSGAELAEELERLGARFGASAGWEGTSVDLYCLADRLRDAFALLAEAVRMPSFPPEEVDRAREQQLAGMKQRLMDPGALADDVALTRYFARNVPYARPLEGTLGSVRPLGEADLAAYAAGNYLPEGGGLIVAGDVDSNEILDMAQEYLGAWVGAPESSGAFDVRPDSSERRVLVVDRPGSVQSEIRVGHIGAARATDDYFPLAIANMVFGGMFTSRLNLNLRERNGFTYGVRSRFSLRSHPGPFQISTAVGNESTAPAVREILTELERFAEAGPGEDEVAAARDYAAGVFGLQLETAGQVASRLTQLVVFGLSDGYFHQYRDRVRSVTTQEVAEASGRHMRPREAQIVVVGDADAVAGPLERLAIGPLEVRREANAE